MSKSKARFLAELLNDSGRVKKDKSQLTGGDNTIDLDSLPTITNAKLQNSSISIAGHSTALGGSVSLNTGDITEHTDYKYYTDTRVRAAVSVTDSGGDGSLAYNSSTGVITYTGPSAAEVRAHISASTGISITDGAISTASIPNASLTNSSVTINSNSLSLGGTLTLDTDDIGEGSSNLYYTDARARSAISVSGNALSYNSSTGVISSSYEESPTFTGNVTISGNLSVTGTTTTIDTANLNVEDKNITLNYSTGDSSANADGAGITIQDAVDSSTDATILWDATNDEFDFSHAVNINGKLTANNEFRLDNGTGGTTHLNYQDGGSNYIRGTTTYIDTPLDLNSNNITDAGTITSGNIGINASASGTYPLYMESGQRYLIGLKNTTGDANYPWLIHDTYNSEAAFRVHFNSVGDRLTLTESGDLIVHNTVLFGQAKLSHSTDQTWRGLTIQNTGDTNECTVDGKSSDGTQQFVVYGGGQSQGFLHPTSYGWRLKVPLTGSLERDGSHTIWDAGNDGSGSGLDADLLDGVQGASFLRSDATDTATGALTFTGNLNQTGGSFISHGFTTTNLNSAWQAAGTSKGEGIAPFRFQDSASNKPDSGNNAHWGLNIYAHPGSGGSYPYGTQLSAGSTQHLYHRWFSNGAAGSWRKVWDSSNDGSGSGLDADLLDGQQLAALQQAYARVQGWNPAYANSDEASVYYDFSERAVVIDSANDSSIGAAYKAFPVTAGEQIKFNVQIKGDAAYGSGVYVRIYYYTGDLPNGKTHVSNAAGHALVQEDSGGDTGWFENGSVGTSYTSFNRTWTAPTTGFASLVVLNWSPISSGKIFVKDATYEKIGSVAANLSGDFPSFVQIGDSSSYGTNSGNWGARLNVTDDVHAKIEVGHDSDSMLSHWYSHNGHDSIKFGTSSGHDVELQRAGTTKFELTSSGTTAYENMTFSSGRIGRGNHQLGFLEGSYNNVGANSDKTNPIYTIGSNYNPTATSFSNMYGIGYAHPNLWGTGSGKNVDWGLYSVASGTVNFIAGLNGTWSSGQFNRSGNTVWDAGNDGAGSGLDADLLDGVHGNGYQQQRQVGFYVAGQADRFYKVKIPVSGKGDNIKVFRQYNWTIGGSSSSWNSGSTTHFGALHFQANLLRNDWGGHRSVVHGTVSHNYTIVAARAHMGSGSEHSNFVIYLRGGAGGSGAYYEYCLERGATSAPTVDYNTYLTSADTEFNYSYANNVINDDLNEIYLSSNKIWHQGNDGAGTGLDADTVDGIQAASTIHKLSNSGYYRPDTWIDMRDSGGAGLYWGSGTGAGWHIYPVNSEDMYIRSGASGAAALQMNTAGTARGYVYANSSNQIGFLNNNRSWRLRVTSDGYIQRSADGTNFSVVWHSGNDGSGTGLDADTVDGIHGASLLRSDTADTASGKITMSQGIARGNHHVGHLEGSYNNVGGNSSKSNPIYTIGSSYNPTVSALNNMYGIGYAHANFWGSSKTSDWGMYVAANGSFNATIGAGDVTAWFASKVYAGGYYYNSDRSLKENIKPLKNSLEKVQKLQGVSYNLIETKEEHIGFIAQEVEEVVPELVKGEEGKKVLNYAQMVALLTEAVKEQQAQIQNLQKELGELKNAKTK